MGEGESLSLTRLLFRYQTVKILHEEKGYSIQDLCPLAHIARSFYYKWLNHPKSQHELENEKISAAIQQIYTEHSDKGHRRIRDDLEKDYGILTSNKLVFDTFDKAVQENPNAHPMLHSDRGYQYTSRIFHKKLLDAGLTPSMSRVGRCIDNGPMEGFWGILKRECYYGHTFSRESLFSTIENYIDYYNNRRYQHRLFIQTPMQAHVSAMNRGA